MVMLLLITREGLGMSPDGVDYLDAAKNFARGKGLMLSGPEGEFLPFIHYPPLFPIFLATMEFLGLSTEVELRYLNVLLLGLSTMLFYLVLREGKIRISVAAICSLLFSFSMGSLLSFAFVQSETIFIPLLILCWLCLKQYTQSRKTSRLVLMAILCALCTSVRYAGLFVLIWLVFTLVSSKFFRPRDLIYFLLTALLFLFGLFYPFSGFEQTNRVFAMHLPDVTDITSLVNVVISWLAGVGLSGKLRAGLFLIIVMFSILPLKADSYSDVRSELLFVIVYLFGLLFTRSFLDAAMPFDYRLMLPTLPFFLYPLALGLNRQKGRYSFLKPLILLPACVLLFIDGLALYQSAKEGLGINSTELKADLFLQGLSSPGTIYSNSPEVLMHHLGRKPKRLPQYSDKYSLLPNQNLDNQLAEWKKDLSSGSVRVLIFGPEHELIANSLPGPVRQELVLIENNRRAALYSVKRR